MSISSDASSAFETKTQPEHMSDSGGSDDEKEEKDAVPVCLELQKPNLTSIMKSYLYRLRRDVVARAKLK